MVLGAVLMFGADRPTGDPIDMYNRWGFAVLKILDEDQVRILERFTKAWVYRLLAQWTAGRENSLPLETYHIWSKSLLIDHGSIFCAGNRHVCPDREIENILISNDQLKSFLREIGVERYEVWDEGLGWLGFRYIRPRMGDGYPFSRKAWGIAQNVISFWVPIIGNNPSETLTLVPGSHLKDYDKHLPTDGKFRKDEYRLTNVPSALERYNPKLARGEIIVYHPKTLHSENVAAGNVTRLSLEFRINPIDMGASVSGVRSYGNK